MLSLEDLVDDSETSSLPLTVTRIYSAYIHKRRTEGPMGMGWLLNFWYVRLQLRLLYNDKYELLFLKGITH